MQPIGFLSQLPAGSAAGSILTIADPGSSDAELGVLVVTTDVAQWITLGFGAQGGTVGDLATQGGPLSVQLFVGLAIDWHGMTLGALGAQGRQVTVQTSAISGLGCILGGCTIP
jgi:hypothetical protein